MYYINITEYLFRINIYTQNFIYCQGSRGQQGDAGPVGEMGFEVSCYALLSLNNIDIFISFYLLFYLLLIICIIYQ